MSTYDTQKSFEKTGKAKRREKKLKNEPQSVTMDNVPDSLKVMDFFEARAKEFNSMTEALKKKGGSKRTFQKLPRHMRRRAMSHNVKRLPRRLREDGSHEIDNKKESNKKDPRRKRRRPKNLKTVYQKRQQNKKWLETHIWHAKRMKMVDKWGYRLAQHCNDKGKRANYRYCKDGAILSDISYFPCIEVQGKECNLSQFLTPLFPINTGPTPLSFIDGHKEGVAIMYKPHLYPYHCIGPVSFLWEPVTMAIDKLRKIWFWVHPSTYREVLGIFETEANLLSQSGNESDLLQPQSGNESEPIVRVTSLRDELVRFRLVGPKSLEVLMSILNPKKLPIKDQNGETQATPTEGVEYLKSSRNWPEISKTSTQRKWWVESDVIANNIIVEAKLKQILGNENCVDDLSVFGLVVEDPRLVRPSKRIVIGSMKSVKDKQVDWLQGMSDMLTELGESDDAHSLVTDNNVETETTQLNCERISETLSTVITNNDSTDDRSFDNTAVFSLSSLWSTTVRHSVSTSIIPHYVVNEIKSNLFMQPDKLNLGDESSLIPVILVRKSYSLHSKKRPVTFNLSGWDVILPANWGMAFWVPLVYQGARACGLDELSTCIGLECLQTDFPFDFPDSFAGQTAAMESQEELTSKYMRYPPDKRPNFGKLNVNDPFGCDWNELINHNTIVESGDKRPLVGVVRQRGDKIPRVSAPHHDGIEQANGYHGDRYYVLRCSEDLGRLTRFIDTLFSKCWRKKRTQDKYQQLFERHEIQSLLSRHRQSLVTVQLEVWSRGTLDSHSIIAIPNKEDFIGLKNTESVALGPVESMCPNGVTLVEDGCIIIGQTELASKKVKSIQKDRKKLRKIDHERTLSKEDTGIIEQYHLSPVTSSRTTIGRVHETVDYRYISSLYAGIGHCSLQGLVDLCETCYVFGSYQLLCLTRGHGTCQYVFTLLKIHSL